MRTLLASATVLVLALAARSANGDGLFYQLPKDGLWVNYEFDAVLQEKGLQRENASGSIRMASVGQTSVAGEPCRWIEVKFEMIYGEQKIKQKPITAKVLIPEKHLGKGKDPLDNVVRAWKKKGSGAPKELKDFEDARDAPLPLILAPPLKNAKQLSAVETSSKLGELSCVGVTGTAQFLVDNREQMDVTFENRLHPKSPFGVVASRWDIKVSKKGQTMVTMTWNLKLSDLGENAKSELPEQK